MNDKYYNGKISFAEFHSVDVKRNWTHLAEKNSRPGTKITAFRLTAKYFNRTILKNILKTSVLL